MKIKQWFYMSVNMFNKYSISVYDIEIIFFIVFKKKRTWIFKNFNKIIFLKKLNQLNYLLSKRLNSEPLDYIIGNKNFFSLNFIISKYTLIPRTDTEILVKKILLKIKKYNSLILDLGTGCGNISLSIAKNNLKLKIIGVDYNKKAIKIAKKNSFLLNLKNVFFLHSNWFNSVKNIFFDIIVSNPPYISYSDVSLLKKNIFFEPFNSLLSNKRGLKEIKYIIQTAKKYLNDGGWLLIEHSFLNKNKIIFLFKLNKYKSISSFKDNNGINRITLGKK
ncbi:peptide chain release factor N(5)-glutamine methyltransferase [Buchnera aphidicola]|uniref:peptide chain release factor N(5)-glutamine methyltransferase n=1 Tax=Buchnera aphidicola TaxID=9 RepID=UPI0031B81193